MIKFIGRSSLISGLLFLFFSCTENSPTSPYAPETPADDKKSWQEVLAEDAGYPDNVYLTKFIEWSPGLVGSSRRGTAYTDEAGYPLKETTVNALGPPEGSGSYTGGEGLTCPVGVNGWAVWEFDPGYAIINGTGDDFITFTKTWAWSSTADGLCCELARVEISEDCTQWYELDSSKINYDVNPYPTRNNSQYVYRNISGLHGNAPTWANFRKEMKAEVLQTSNGIEKWTELENVSISRYFTADEDYLGGIRFDLADFHLKGDPSSLWPEDGRMKFLKIMDDETILDGQDYDKSWSLGANLMAAMGINTIRIQ